MTIHETVKTARLAAGLTQRQVANAIGYDSKNADVIIQNIEAGKKPIPLARMRILAETLKIPLDKLIP